MKLAALSALLLFGLAFFGAGALARPGIDGPITNPVDFRAFYCGAQALRTGANPYLTEPLRTCETQALRSERLQWAAGLAVPAPLPPYALAALAPISILPFPLASQLWFALLVLSVGVSIVLLQRLTGLPALLVAAVIVPADAFASVVNGQIVPFVVCALCAAALLVRTQRPHFAAFAVLLTLIEPHIGLAACLGLALWEPRARSTIALSVALLAAGSVALVGWHTALQYAFAVLPAHARSELVNFAGQYSFSSALYELGAGDMVSLMLGQLSYAFALVAGVWLARELAERFGDKAFLVVAPPLFVLIGGSFVHIHQMALALPFALLLVAVSADAPYRRGALLACALLLGVPWESLAESGAIAAHLPSRAPAVVQVAATQGVAEPGAARSDDIAEVSWTAWVRAAAARETRPTSVLWATKTPTWLALLGLAGCAWFSVAQQARRRRVLRRLKTRAV